MQLYIQSVSLVDHEKLWVIQICIPADAVETTAFVIFRIKIRILWRGVTVSFQALTKWLIYCC